MFGSWFRVIDESPRWLLIQHKYEEAELVIHKIAHTNRASLPKQFNVRAIKAVKYEMLLNQSYWKLLNFDKWKPLRNMYRWTSASNLFYTMHINNKISYFQRKRKPEVRSLCWIWWDHLHWDGELLFWTCTGMENNFQ